MDNKKKEPKTKSADGVEAGGNKGRKQLLLRISEALWRDLAAWAEDDFRSINGQIEYLLSENVKRRKRGSRANTEPDENEDE